MQSGQPFAGVPLWSWNRRDAHIANAEGLLFILFSHCRLSLQLLVARPLRARVPAFAGAYPRLILLETIRAANRLSSSRVSVGIARWRL